MAHGPFNAELRQLRTIFAGQSSDADLMTRFVEKRDEAAFASLVRRHGGLVLRVCRNVLHQQADADDAFQATFLVLARKAGSFRKEMSLACWLHGVAYRCSMNLRKSAMRRRAREKAAAGERPSEGTVSRAAWNELQACLHEEVERLPAAHRAAFVLCVLEDKGRAEAARALGCPEGTLSSRLAKARKILQKRLTARGVTLSAALGMAAIATGAGSASAALVHQTTTAALAFTAGSAAGAVSAKALALAEGVLRGMLLTKAKLGAMLMIVVMLGVVAGGLVAQPSGPEVPAEKVVAPPPAPLAANDKPEPRGKKQAHVDSRGDALPEAALVRLGSSRMRHGGWIAGSALSPDGKILATAGERSLILWDLDSGKEMHRFSFDRTAPGMPGLVFAPDGSHLAYVRNDHIARIWNPRTGKEIHRIDLPPDDAKNAGGHLTGVCRFVNDGKDLLYGTDSALHRYNFEAKRVVESIPIKNVSNLSPDGKSFFEREYKNKELILTEVGSGKTLFRAEGTICRFAYQVAFSADGKSFAFVHDQRELQHRAMKDGKILASFTLPKRQVGDPPGGIESFCPEFSADGKTLFLVTREEFRGITHRWDLATGRELPALDRDSGRAARVHVLPDRRTLVTAMSDGRIRKWDAETGQPLPEPDRYEGMQPSVAYSDNGRFAAVGDNRGRVDLWDAASAKLLRTLQKEGTLPINRLPRQLAFAPGSELLAMVEISGTVRFWRIPSGKPGAVWERKPAKDGWPGTTIHFSPDGRSLAISEVGQLRMVETATGRSFWTAPQSWVKSFSADGATLFVEPSKSQRLALLDAKTGKSKSTVQFDASDGFGPLPKIASSADGRCLAVIFGGGCLGLCDGRTGEEKRRLHTFDNSPEALANADSNWDDLPRTIAFSADSRWLAVGDDVGGITIWEVETGASVLRLPGHDAEVCALAFSPDGRTLNSFGQDGQGYRWNLAPNVADGRRASFAELWDALDHAKPAEAYRAQWRMIADPKGSAAFLRDRLKPTPMPDAGKIRKWIADLDSEAFTVRETASRELTKIGEAVQTPIREALKKDPPAETQRRLTQILATVSNAPVPGSVRLVRAIMVLERIGSAEARGVLETMSRGAPGTRVTEDAAAALQRLDKIAQGP